jgi:hypothetical protein
MRTQTTMLFALPKPAKVVLIHCPREGCTHRASATTDGKALQALASHYKHKHLQGDPKDAA